MHCLISAKNPPEFGNEAFCHCWLWHLLDTNLKKKIAHCSGDWCIFPLSFQSCQSYCSKCFSGITKKLMTVHNNHPCLSHFTEPNPSCYMEAEKMFSFILSSDTVALHPHWQSLYLWDHYSYNSDSADSSIIKADDFKQCSVQLLDCETLMLTGLFMQALSILRNDCIITAWILP